VRVLVALAVGVALLLGGCGESVEPGSVTVPNPGVVEPGPTGPIPSGPPLGESDSAAAEVQAAEPTQIRIPPIGVDAPIIPLGLRADGRIEVPADYDETGWWVDGPEPGEPGPAVILGHVDSRDGPAVFFDLRLLEPGDPISIDRRDGTTVTYLVERTEQHPKDAFPTNAVYGPTPDPVLRLVTCGGDFDRDRRSYDDNIIVYARLAGP
jgi:sortase (surface protein transpeptidase)